MQNYLGIFYNSAAELNVMLLFAVVVGHNSVGEQSQLSLDS